MGTHKSTIVTASLLLAVCACGKPAAPQPGATPVASTAETEQHQLDGVWKYVSFQLDGVKMPEDLFQGHQYVFKGKHFTRTDAGGDSKGTFKLDVSTKPWTIDLTDDKLKDDPLPGICELSGDTLTLCLPLGAEDRPKEFSSKPKSGHGLIVLKREKP